MGYNQIKEGHGPAPIHMAEILVIILATNSHLQSNILFYHMRHVSLRYFTSSVSEGGHHEMLLMLMFVQLHLIGSQVITR